MMKFAKPVSLFTGLVLLVSCSHLSNGLRRDIAYENDRVTAAERQLEQSQRALLADLSQAPELFRDVPAPQEWKNRLHSDHDKLDAAKKIGSELAEIARRDRGDSEAHARQQLIQQRQLVSGAESDSQAVLASAGKWLDFSRNLPSHLDKMRAEYSAICNFDLAPVTKDVERAGHDWPAKKQALDDRLNALHNLQTQAESEWSATEALRQTAAASKVTGPALATVIETDDQLARGSAHLSTGVAELHDLSAQLYDSWDKILTDLDDPHYGQDQVFRERIKTVRTHLTDVASRKGETTSTEHWVNVSEPEFRAVKNDVGMAISHKDAGLFDSEAQTTPQPAGFAYIAPESQGSNQYGYWDHSGGHSVWTWLPEYLILRELLWNHDYRPVIADEYRGYRTAQDSGRTYYGQSTPAAPPKYGTHGTFTQTHYGDSRYVQKGGFSSSAYASHPGSGATAARPQPHEEPGFNGSAGRRFGSGARPPSGRQFGRSGGFRGPGRSFGRRR